MSGLSCMCGPVDDDGGAHARAHTMPAPLPPSSPASSVERMYLHKLLTSPERQHMGPRSCACAHAYHTECLVVSVRSVPPGSGSGRSQGRSLLAGGADDVKVEIACPQCDVRGVFTPAEWTRCVGIADGPPLRRRTGRVKGGRESGRL